MCYRISISIRIVRNILLFLFILVYQLLENGTIQDICG
jgi:hypothetical protein